MLIRFNVKNFLSFNESEEGKSVEFSMIAGESLTKRKHLYEGNIRLLKLATVYGANASGKSNLVKALDFTKKTIIDGLPEGHTNKYCRTSKKNKDLPSYFELEIKIGNRYFAYGFECILSQSKFISEWLIELNAGDDTIIFTRDIERGKFIFGDSIEWKTDTKNKLNVYADDIKNVDNVLFLKVMNQYKKTSYAEDEMLEVFRNVYNWIDEKLDINYANMPIANYGYLSKSDNVEKICNIISSFGMGITNFSMVDMSAREVIQNLPGEIQKRLESDIEGIQLSLNRENTKNTSNQFGVIIRFMQDLFIITISKNNVSCKTLQFQHETEDVLFDFGEESDGTRRILDLMDVLLSDEEKTYVIDELDRCLHPSLSYHFIEMFLKIAETKNIQLIVTTHESRLLDFDLLRRDEIWFIDKKHSGESEIYSLDEYNDRFDKKIDKAYLEGRYGGVPIFTTMFPITDGE